MLEVNAEQLKKQMINIDNIGSSSTLKNKYHKLSEFLKKQEMLTKMLLKLGYEKNLLGKERKIIKKNKQTGHKSHKFFI